MSDHKREFDPDTPQVSYDTEYMMIIASNYTPGEAINVTVEQTYAAMIEHVEIILRYPKLFE